MLADEDGDTVEDVAHLLARGHRLQLALGQLDGEVEVALVAGVDHRWRLGSAGAAEHAGQDGDGPLGGRQADALGPTGGDVLQALEGEGEV